ncbi:MAG TPA: YcjX family protein [Aestuariivirgaceae bacterium]|jgi:predicted YcjX-like family ATPase
MSPSIIDETRIALGGLRDFARGLTSPNLRLGVTGLARSGKTVFITALVHNLIHGGRLPLLSAYAGGRIVRAYLEPQPDFELPRFAYEAHVESLTGENRAWPESTKRLSELRLTIEYMSRGLFSRDGVPRQLSIDILDYPGEWLLDLPLMELSYSQWSAATIAASRKQPRASLAKNFHELLSSLDPHARHEELQAVKAAELFTSYLSRCRGEEIALSTVPPGRFLMPGDLAGSPLLTFAPLDVAADAAPRRGSLFALMQRRYEAYVTQVVKPFFINYFARLDRQIVLIDALSALNAGREAIADLRIALTEILAVYRQGSSSWASQILGRRIDRILFAATKADQLHHSSHNRLESIMRAMLKDASARARFKGAAVDVSALAAIRATREAMVRQRSQELPCIVGMPEKGERIGTSVFDGVTEAAVFPGDLPENPSEALRGGLEAQVRFIRFRPPVLKPLNELGLGASFPHIRLDRALEFLIGDRLS